MADEAWDGPNSGDSNVVRSAFGRPREHGKILGIAGVDPRLVCGYAPWSRKRHMGAFSGFLIIVGVMTLFGSAMSLGLTFLHSIQGDSWAPLRTGSFISNYIGVD